MSSLNASGQYQHGSPAIHLPEEQHPILGCFAQDLQLSHGRLSLDEIEIKGYDEGTLSSLLPS